MTSLAVIVSIHVSHKINTAGFEISTDDDISTVQGVDYCLNQIYLFRPLTGIGISDQVVKKKPDLMFLLFVLFGLGVVFNTGGQVLGL